MQIVNFFLNDDVSTSAGFFMLFCDSFTSEFIWNLCKLDTFVFVSFCSKFLYEFMGRGE